MLDFLLDPAHLATLFTLSAMEIVLGIDNLVLIAILSDKLPLEKQPFARRFGIIAALLTRVMLLSLVFMLSTLTTTAFHIGDWGVTWRDVLLFAGGAFLLFKGVKEMAGQIFPEEKEPKLQGASGLVLVIMQIGFMDIVFSFDSVMTAIGLAEHIGVMILAVVIAMGVMLLAVDPVSRFISNNPSIKVLALAYMLLIGVTLIMEAFHAHIPRGYVYSAMGFSFFVEMMNWWARRNRIAKTLSK